MNKDASGAPCLRKLSQESIANDLYLFTFSRLNYMDTGAGAGPWELETTNQGES